MRSSSGLELAGILALLMRRELRITPSRRYHVPGPQLPRVLSVVREMAPLAAALLYIAQSGNAVHGGLVLFAERRIMPWHASMRETS